MVQTEEKQRAFSIAAAILVGRVKIMSLLNTVEYLGRNGLSQ